MRPLAILLLIAGPILTRLPAQGCVEAPPRRTGASTRSERVPFLPDHAGRNNHFYQVLVPSSVLGLTSGPIRELSFVALGRGALRFASIRVRIDHTKASKLDARFANNLGAKAVTVLDARGYVWPLRASGFTRIGLTRPFVRSPIFGPNLVVEIECRGAQILPGSTVLGFRTRGKVERKFASGWTRKPPQKGQEASSFAGLDVELCFDLADVSFYGLGCSGKLAVLPGIGARGVPSLGQSFSLELGLASGATQAILVAGFRSLSPYPIDLGDFGAPGCKLAITLDLLLPLPVAQGRARATFAVPNQAALAGFAAYAQFLALAPKANKLGVVTTRYARVRIGR